MRGLRNLALTCQHLPELSAGSEGSEFGVSPHRVPRAFFRDAEPDVRFDPALITKGNEQWGISPIHTLDNPEGMRHGQCSFR